MMMTTMINKVILTETVVQLGVWQRRQYNLMIAMIVMAMVSVAKVRLGGDEEHRRWDAREELREQLEGAVKELELSGKFEFDEELDEFMYKLLIDNAVIEALRGGKKGQLEELIKQKRKTFVSTYERGQMLDILKEATSDALGADHGTSVNELNLQLEDRTIFEATKAVRVSYKAFQSSGENSDKEALRAASHNLFMVLGNAR